MSLNRFHGHDSLWNKKSATITNGEEGDSTFSELPVCLKQTAVTMHKPPSKHISWSTRNEHTRTKKSTSWFLSSYSFDVRTANGACANRGLGTVLFYLRTSVQCEEACDQTRTGYCLEREQEKKGMNLYSHGARVTCALHSPSQAL